MAEAAAALVVEDLHKSFGELEVLKGVSLSANEGDVISMIGSSGSGEEHLAPLHQPPGNARCGRVYVEGELIKMRPTRNGHAIPEDHNESTASARAWAWCSRVLTFGRT
jgi:ABC-type histidine transport system ATPase subunit